MNQRTGGEIGLDLIVQRDVLRGGVHIIERPQRGSEIGKQAFGTDAGQIVRHVEVAEIRPELQIIVEPVLERIADRKLFQLVAIGAGLADVPAIGNAAERIGSQPRRVARHILLPSLVVDVLVLRQDRERRVRRRPPRQAGCDEHLVLMHEVLLPVGAVAETDDAVEKLAILVDRPRRVEGALKAVERTESADDFVLWRGCRTLADHVDETARIGLAVKARRRPPQHFNPFKAVSLDASERRIAFRDRAATEGHRDSAVRRSREA